MLCCSAHVISLDYQITPLLRNTFLRMAQEVKLALMEHRVLGVRKAILYGRAGGRTAWYAVTYSIDLIAITSSVAESRQGHCRHSH